MQSLGNDSELAVKKDQKYLWHNITPYSEKNPPMIAASASGSWITDIQGNRFLDGMSGLWCVNVGYGRKELAEAAYNQLLTLPYFPLTQSHLPAIALAEKLNEWLGDDYVIFFPIVDRKPMRLLSKWPASTSSKSASIIAINSLPVIVGTMAVHLGHYLQRARPSANINMNRWRVVFCM